jgi:hypothetical protein
MVAGTFVFGGAILFNDRESACRCFQPVFNVSKDMKKI